MTPDRRESWIGAVGVALLALALFLPGPPPKTDDSITKLTASLVQHRGALVGGIPLAGLGVMALLWFFGIVGARLRNDGGSAARATAAVAGGIAGTLLMFVGMVLFSGAAFRAASMGDQALVRTTVDTGNMLVETSKYGFAVLIAATCAAAAGTELLSRRMVVAGWAATALLIVSSVPEFFANHGVGQFGGGIDLVGGAPGFVWLIALSVALRREAVPA